MRSGDDHRRLRQSSQQKMREDVDVLSTQQPHFHRCGQGLFDQPQSVSRIHLAPLGPTKNSRRIYEQYSLHARFRADLEEHANAALERLQRIRKRGRFRDELGMHLLHDRIDNSFEHALFAVVVMVQRASGDVRLGDQLFRADACKSALGEQLAGNLLELPLRGECLCRLRSIHTACMELFAARINSICPTYIRYVSKEEVDFCDNGIPTVRSGSTGRSAIRTLWRRSPAWSLP